MSKQPEEEHIAPTEYFGPNDSASTANQGTGAAADSDTWRVASSDKDLPRDLPEIPGYAPLGFVASGGMGYVIKARHEVLDRIVAIKLPLPSAVADEESRQRFLREARASARLQHPNICPIHEVGEVEGRPFIVMGFVDGETLGAWQKRTSPSARAAAEVVAPLARAVHDAHQHDVLHRDIKPGNVMVETDSGQPVLMDFGLAKELSQEKSDLTQTGQVMGTPAYMAPEQAAGDIERVGPHSDIYALGAVLYQLICGQPPFSGNVGSILHQVQGEEPVAPRKIAPRTHRDLETICLKAMAKQPEQRYATAAALADDLERFCAGESILARREGIGKRGLRLVRRHKVAIGAFALLLVTASVVTGFLLSGTQRAEELADLARQFNDGLRTDQWTEQHLVSMEQLATRIEALDAESGRRLRQRLPEAYAEHLQRQMTTSAELLNDDRQSIEQGLAWLEARRPDSVATLRKLFSQRLRNWQPVFTLVSPYENASDVIDPRYTQIADDRLMRSGADRHAQRPAIVETRIPSRGNVQIEAVFDSSWSDQRALALRILSQGRQGYEFRLSTWTPPRATQPVGNAGGIQDETGIPRTPIDRFAAAKRQGDIQMEILRDAVVLRRRELSLHQLRPHINRELRMIGSREGRKLNFQIGDRIVLTFEDIFPKSGASGGVFGLAWPREVGLLSLRALRQPLPEVASPNERGDALMARGSWLEALQQYQQQATLAERPADRHEAAYKQAICLRQLSRDDEAVAILEQLLTEAKGDVYVIAASQLWLLRLRQRRFDEAEAIYGSLSSQHEFEDLVRLIPSSDRQEIINESYKVARGYNLLNFNRTSLHYLQQADMAERLLEGEVGWRQHIVRQHNLIRGHHILGEIDQATLLAKRTLDRYERTGGIAGERLMYLQEYCWLLRQQGRAEAVLRYLKKIQESGSLDGRHADRFLVARIRTHAALGNWEQAASELDDFISGKNSWDSYRGYASTWLMRGFLHKRNGDEKNTLEAWRKAHFSRWAEMLRGQGRTPARPSGMEFEFAVVAGALSGEFTKAELAELVSYFDVTFHGIAAGPAILSQAHIITPAIARIGKDESAVEQLRQVVFQEVPLDEFIRIPLRLIAIEISSRAAPSGRWSEAERQVLWQAGTDVFDSYQQNQIATSHGLQLLATWKGVNSLFGWKGVAAFLPANIKGPAAYVFGHRYERLGRKDEAAAFFRTASDAAADQATLRNLADQQLERLNAGPVVSPKAQSKSP